MTEGNTNLADASLGSTQKAVVDSSKPGALTYSPNIPNPPSQSVNNSGQTTAQSFVGRKKSPMLDNVMAVATLIMLFIVPFLGVVLVVISIGVLTSKSNKISPIKQRSVPQRFVHYIGVMAISVVVGIMTIYTLVAIVLSTSGI